MQLLPVEPVTDRHPRASSLHLDSMALAPVCGGRDRFRTITAERDRGGWICNGCGTSGDGIDLVARAHGVQIGESVHMIADVLGYPYR